MCPSPAAVDGERRGAAAGDTVERIERARRRRSVVGTRCGLRRPAWTRTAARCSAGSSAQSCGRRIAACERRARSRRCSPASTGASSRPGRRARRRAAGPTCCRPGGISTPSTCAPCRPRRPGASGGRRPSAWSRTTGRSRANGRARSRCPPGAPPNMRTGGDDIAQALALIGARPVWEAGSGRVTGFTSCRSPS